MADRVGRMVTPVKWHAPVISEVHEGAGAGRGRVFVCSVAKAGAKDKLLFG